MKVLSSVPVFRLVATADVAARHAHAQVHPFIAELQAFFTALGARGDGPDHAKVRALDIHGSAP
jgi:hypothetical protein